MASITFRKIATAVLAGLMLATAAGCGAPAKADALTSSGESPVSSAPSSTPSSDVSAPASESASDPAAVNIQPEPITAEQADKAAGSETKLYRGIVLDFAMTDAGQTVWILMQDTGADYGASTLNVVVTPELLMGSVGQQAEIANGTHLEVFYTEMKLAEGSLTQEVVPVAVNVLLPADMVTFNGKVVEITPDPAKPGFGDILVDPIDTGMQTVYHYSPETVFTGLTADSIKVGDELHLLSNGAATRSIPPQTSALAVRPYVLSESCTLVPKAPVA